RDWSSDVCSSDLFVGFFHCGFFRSYTDAFNFHAGQFAAMPNCAVIAFAPLILERDNLLVLALLDHFSRYLCSGNDWVPMRHVLSVGKHKDITEGRCLAGIDIEKIDIDRVAFRDAKLSASGLNNCVSHKKFGRKAAQSSIDGRAWQTESMRLAPEALCHFQPGAKPQEKIGLRLGKR